MHKQNHYTGLQTTALIVLRFLVGWHILYEGIAKLLDPEWTSFSFLKQSQGVLSGFADWVTANPNVLNLVDILNTWGLIAIGLGLILGIFARAAAVFGALLIFVYYLNAPPLIGVEYALPVDGNYLIVDKTLIEAASLCVLALFPTSSVFGLDALLWRRKSKSREDLR